MAMSCYKCEAIKAMQTRFKFDKDIIIKYINVCSCVFSFH